MIRYLKEQQIDDYILEKNDTGQYAVFKKCKGFTQQITKWYTYRAYAVKQFYNYVNR